MQDQNKITVIKSNSSIGKRFWYDENGTIQSESTTGFDFTAVTRQVDTVEDMAYLLNGLSDKEAIMTGYCPLFKVDERYKITTVSTFEKLSGVLPDKKYKNPRKMNILKIGNDNIITRTRHYFKPSNWLCIDFDSSSDAPVDLLQRVEERGVVPLLADIMQEFKGVGYVEGLSSKGRVYSAATNEPVFNQNKHTYVLMDKPEHRRVLGSILVNSRGTDIGYISRHFNPVTGDRIRRLDKFTCIADQSSGDIARVFYEGAPICGEGLYSIYNEPKVVKGEVLNSAVYINPDKLDSATEYVNTTWQVINTKDLTPDIPMQGADGVWFTMPDVISGNVDGFDYEAGHMRIQNPFKPESTSLSAYIRTLDAFGERIPIFVFSNEMGKYMYNDTAEVMDALKADTPTKKTTGAPPPPPSLPKKTTGAPPPPVTKAIAPPVTKAIAPPPPVTKAIAPTVDIIDVGYFKNTTDVVPEDIDENEKARYMLNNVLSDLQMITDEYGETMYFNGVGYVKFRKIEQEIFIRKLISNSHTGITSNGVLSMIRALTGETLVACDTLNKPARNLLPFNNGVYDLITGSFERNTGQHHFMCSNVLELNYDPTQTDASLFLSTVRNAFEDDQEQIDRALDLMAYHVFDYGNSNSIIIWFKGGSGCGKSTFANLLNKFIFNITNIGINELGSKKVKHAIVSGVGTIYDDDADSPSFLDKSAVATRLKQIITGAHQQAEVLYSNDTIKAYVKVKMLACCNLFPNIDDSSGAVLRRSEILLFTNSFTDSNTEDNSLFARLEEPESMSAIFNMLRERYCELVQRSGFDTVQDYIDNPVNKLRIHESEVSSEEMHYCNIENNPLIGWLHDVVEKSDTDHCTLTELYEAYRRQSGEQGGIRLKGNIAVVQSKIKSLLIRMGYEYVRITVDGERMRVINGCKLVTDFPF